MSKFILLFLLFSSIVVAEEDNHKKYAIEFLQKILRVSQESSQIIQKQQKNTNIPGETCDQGKIYDCSLNCVDIDITEQSINNGYCNSDQWELNLNCSAFNNDGDDCKPNIPGDQCGYGMVYDCNLNCVPEKVVSAWIDDGVCDDGSWSNITLTCEAFNNDGRDCEFNKIQPGDICLSDPNGNPISFYDCSKNCINSEDITSALGNGYCDDGSSGLDLNCRFFNEDNGDCKQEEEEEDQPIEPVVDDSNEIENAGFEEGASAWTVNSNTGEKVICDIKSCGTETGGPASGESWARLGGTKPGDRVEIKQQVVLEKLKQNLEISFLLRIQALYAAQQRLSLPLAGFNVWLNNIPLLSISGKEEPNYRSYSQIPISISNFDPEKEYEISFTSIISDTGNEGPEEYDAIYFLVDDIQFGQRQWLKNGNFEQKDVFWKSEGPSSICSIEDCDQLGGVGAHSGQAWAIFGQQQNQKASISQSFKLEPARSAQLSFYLAIPVNTAKAYFKVWVDDQLLYQVHNDSNYLDYRLINIDLSLFADGKEHVLKFESYTYFSLIYKTYYLLDDIQIKVDDLLNEKDCEGDSVVIIGKIEKDYRCEAKMIRTAGEVIVNPQVKTELDADFIQFGPLFQVKSGGELIVK